MDPLHQQILDRLAGELDGRVFEDCVCDLLRDVFPSLVPVRGGSDAGMDGAIADGEEEPFPLICTTRHDFHRNLVASLDSFLLRGRRPRKAVFATSQEITPEKRYRLEDAAQERDFTLVQIVDRHGLAQRLYWKPRWLRDLLGLSGTPSALSTVPQSRRPLLELEPVGREEDLAWLRSKPGDLVIAGEPGSGKTFLFLHLIRLGWNGLFLVDDNRGEIKTALLEQHPAVVIVDDAHVRPEALVRLRQLREHMEASFSVVATTWTWDQDLGAVTAALPGAQVRELRLLPRHQILEIFKQAGVRGSDDLLRELVDQAANKPGLAATLAHLWKRGAWKEILEGKALHREVLAAFRGALSESLEDLLATLSLGGDRGMGLEPVRLFLEISRPEIRRQTAALAAGGMLGQEGDDALSVWPRRLRTSLLRTVFFSTAASRLEYRSLLAKAPSLAEAIREVATVRQAGALVPGIRDLVLQLGCDEDAAKSAWRRLAGANEEEASWVLQHYSGDVLDIAYALLETIPTAAMARLLDRAAEEASGGETASRAMSLLSAWIQAPPKVEEALHRREGVARAAKRFLQKGGDLGAGVHGICLALKPNQTGSSRDPGLGNTVQLWFAILPLIGLRRIAAIWKEVKNAVPALDRTAWRHVESVLWEWMHPTYAARGAAVSEEAQREMPAFALEVLSDLVPLGRESPGLRARFAWLAARLNASLPIELDRIFELLYPESYAESDPERATAHREALQELAERWAQQDPPEITRRLACYEAEAERIGYSWPRGSQELCRMLAECVADPDLWFQAIVAGHLASTFASPFLMRLVREHHDGWELVAAHCLELGEYQLAAIDALLPIPEVPSFLLRKALDRAAAWPETVETLVRRREMPRESLRAALCHPRWEVALAAAVGRWQARRNNDVPDDLHPEWREAILRARGDDYQTRLQYWLGVILAKDPDLALDWLRARLRDADLAIDLSSAHFAPVVQALRPEHRVQLLGDLPADPVLDVFLPALVGRNKELYRHLLAHCHLRDYHLVPLGGRPDESWSELALQALDAGHAPERIAEAAVRGSGGHVHDGSGVDYWAGWTQAFTAIEHHQRAEMREIGRHGIRIIEGHLQEARSRQQQIGLHGF